MAVSLAHFQQATSNGTSDDLAPPLPQRPLSEAPALPPRPTSAYSIEPDALPPHSNPQALTPTQSQAFANSAPIPAVRLNEAEVKNSQTGLAVYKITRDAAHMPTFLSTKPLVTIKNTETGSVTGTIRFHAVTTDAIDLTINNRRTSLSHSLLFNRWTFRATTVPNSDERWFWGKDKSTGGVKLEDAKRKGRVLARMSGDVLSFDNGRLSEASYEEVLISAVAMAEGARRQRKGGDVADLAGAIGDLAGSGRGSTIAAK